MASVSHDGSMRTWDIRKFQCLHEIPVSIHNLYIRHTKRNLMKAYIQYKTITEQLPLEEPMAQLRSSITLMSFEHYITQIKFTVHPISSNFFFITYASSAFIYLLITTGAFSTKSLASFSPKLNNCLTSLIILIFYAASIELNSTSKLVFYSLKYYYLNHNFLLNRCCYLSSLWSCITLTAS